MEFSFGIDRQEALRYAGMRPSALPAELEPVLQNAMARIRQSAQPRVQHRMLELQRREEGLFLSTGQRLPGGDIGRTLASSHRVLLFAATLGAGVDAALRRAQAGDMTLALLMEGCASAAVESLCDRAQQALVEESGLYGTDRFSPGYGDFPPGVPARPALAAGCAPAHGPACDGRAPAAAAQIGHRPDRPVHLPAAHAPPGLRAMPACLHLSVSKGRSCL